jgi:hypothetical protein
MLEKEFKYFRDHQQELVEKYKGKFVVIIGESVVGAFDSELQAYTETRKAHELGTFLIQQCLPDEGGYIQTFHRVFLPGPALSGL